MKKVLGLRISPLLNGCEPTEIVKTRRAHEKGIRFINLSIIVWM